MRPFTLVATFALAATVSLLAPNAEACSPLYTGTSVVTADDTPDCLVVSGREFYDDGWEATVLNVRNDCTERVVFECVGAGRECGPIELEAQTNLELRVPTGTTTVQWTILDESGLVEFDYTNGDWGGCGSPFGCASAPVDGPSQLPGIPLVFAVLGTAVVRSRKRQFRG